MSLLIRAYTNQFFDKTKAKPSIPAGLSSEKLNSLLIDRAASTFSDIVYRKRICYNQHSHHPLQHHQH